MSEWPWRAGDAEESARAYGLSVIRSTHDRVVLGSLGRRFVLTPAGVSEVTEDGDVVNSSAVTDTAGQVYMVARWSVEPVEVSRRRYAVGA